MKRGDQREEQASGAGSWSGDRARAFMVAAPHPAAATACEHSGSDVSARSPTGPRGSPAPPEKWCQEETCRGVIVRRGRVVGGEGTRSSGFIEQPSVRRSPWRKGKKNMHVLLLSRNRGAAVQGGFLLKTEGESVFIVFTM